MIQGSQACVCQVSPCSGHNTAKNQYHIHSDIVTGTLASGGYTSCFVPLCYTRFKNPSIKGQYTNLTVSVTRQERMTQLTLTSSNLSA